MTIRDLAADTGLSVSTISQVLNGKGRESRIPELTRARVLEAATRLGYRRNRHARALRTGRSNLIGIVGLNLDQPVPLMGVRYVTRAVLERGYDVMLYDQALHPKETDRALADLESHRFEALLGVSPARQQRELFSQMARRGAPVVTLDEAGIPEADEIYVDREEGAYLATRHLLSLGHRHIVLTVSPEATAPVLVARLQGYRRAHDEAGVPLDESLLVPSAASYPSFADGKAIIPDVLKHPARPTALFCLNDRMAIGALRALHEARVRVPEEMAVVGFDGIEEAEYAAVPLTTVAQPVAEVASIAVSLLIDRLERPGRPHVPHRIVVSPRLVVRSSCGAHGAGEGPADLLTNPAGKETYR